MTTRTTPGQRFAVVASAAVALLLAAISVGGLVWPATYARETPSWRTQAIAQDWFDLLIAVPALLLAARGAAGGSTRGRLVLGGVLLFAIYTLVIYGFAIHLNALFLLYCTALGLALHAALALARTARDPAELAEPPAHRGAAGLLIGIGVAFAALWLAQLVPSALTGHPPAELVATGLATNPVHVIDLSFILPLHVLAGVLLWRRRPIGARLAPVLLVFDALMAFSIAFLAAFAERRGVSTGGYAVAIAMAVLGGASTLVVQRLARSSRGERAAVPASAS